MSHVQKSFEGQNQMQNIVMLAKILRLDIEADIKANRWLNLFIQEYVNKEDRPSCTSWM